MDVYIWARLLEKGELIENSAFLPRTGDRVDMFYHPARAVVDVIILPTMDTLFDAGWPYEVTAIVIVE